MTFYELVEEAVKEANTDDIDEFCRKYGIEKRVIYEVADQNLAETIKLALLTSDSSATFLAYGCTMISLGIAIGRRLEHELRGSDN